MEKKIEYVESEKFKKDFKRLEKRFRSLKADLEVAKKYAIEMYHPVKRLDNQSVFLMPGFCDDKVLICKLKKFACRSLKGSSSRSGIRVIYAYKVESQKIVFLEIYFKGDKEMEDRGRIQGYLLSLS